MFKVFVLLVYLVFVYAEVIEPIPKQLSFNKEKAKLGQMLFFDTILSKDRKVSCASCHIPEYGWADNKVVSVGVNGQKGNINSPTVLNAVFNFKQFWNGSVSTLKEQASVPIQRSYEMGLSKQDVEERLNNHSKYKELFKKVYNISYIKFDNVIDAIAEFEKTLITPDSKFDLFLQNKAKLSKIEYKGYMLFKKLGCITCHNGVNLGSNSFQKIGIVIPYDSCGGDRYLITKKEFDKCVYKVPTLRNITLTAPYFHNGSAKTLSQAIKKMAYHNLGIILEEEQIKSIEAFLSTLTSEVRGIK